MQLRLAGQAAKNAGEPVVEKRIRRQLSGQARFAARLGFASPTAYEAWIARGSPEEELPPEVRAAREAALDPDAPMIDEQDSERLQLRTDAAIANLRGVSPNVVTAERMRAEPAPPPQPSEPLRRPMSLWDAFAEQVAAADEEPFEDPFAVSGRRVPRRGSGYWGH